MATTPEEFFIKGLMEQSQPSPPFFLDLPQKSNGRSEGYHHVPNDMMLPFISRVLLEDDIDDNKLNDHPALLQVQQPFAQILSSSFYGTNTSNTDGARDLLEDGRDDESMLNLNSALSKGTDIVSWKAQKRQTCSCPSKTSLEGMCRQIRCSGKATIILGTRRGMIGITIWRSK